ncbi:MAG: phenylalanine--tRNA ligase subunit beta [Immundisolibacteraceae bacterium]|nr:phenylalanine--tRNA ligase subunit beta [Immundisolibacteraceae bacterium]
MLISELWLREWANPELDSPELCERLTLAGLEIGTVAPASANLDKVIVGQIIATSRHPDADRLQLCQVDIGSELPLSIVCGAPNAREGIKVAVAQVGAKLPSGLKIKKSKIRGEVSLGMLCSSSELELDEQNAGILELDTDAPLGKSITSHLQLDDNILEVELTPNRGDCLSAKGLGRDLAAITGVTFTAPEIPSIEPSIDDKLEVILTADQACPRYVGRVIRGINPTATTPLWMRERLRRSGIRSLSLLVDIANYVMIEIGQPMHAFDLAKLQGSVQVRFAKPDESLELLNGETKQLAESLLVIADNRGPIAAAGIMGGLDSAVGKQTTDIFLESAWFNPSTIAGRARQLGLHTDASHRFERGVDPAIQREAIERASQLITSLAGGACGPVVDQQHTDKMPANPKVEFKPELISKRLGMDVDNHRIATILTNLGIEVDNQRSQWAVVAPSWRFDIEIPADLVEEIARVIGYDAIPSVMPSLDPIMQPLSDGLNSIDRLASTMVDRDYQQAITYSFVDPDLQQLFEPDAVAIKLLNPLSADMSVMRYSIWPGLVNAVRFNQNRQQSRIRLFEYGQVFKPIDKELLQPTVISAIISGTKQTESWNEKARPVDFYDLKGDLEHLLAATGRQKDFTFVGGAHPALHPGRSALVLDQGKPIGSIGELHPRIASKLQVSGKCYLFELMVEPLQRRKVPQYQSVSKFPTLRRDLALLVDESQSAGEIEHVVREAAGDRLQNYRLFDVYRDQSLPEGKKSVAIGLDIGDPNKTMADDEIDQIIAAVLAALDSKLEAQLRE